MSLKSIIFTSLATATITCSSFLFNLQQVTSESFFYRCIVKTSFASGIGTETRGLVTGTRAVMNLLMNVCEHYPPFTASRSWHVALWKYLLHIHHSCTQAMVRSAQARTCKRVCLQPDTHAALNENTTYGNTATRWKQWTPGNMTTKRG